MLLKTYKPYILEAAGTYFFFHILSFVTGSLGTSIGLGIVDIWGLSIWKKSRSIGRKPSERIKYLSATCSIFLWCSVVALWRLRIRRGKRSFRMIFIGLAQDRFFVTLSSPVSRQSGVLCSHTIIFMPCGKCYSKKSSGTYES